MAQMSMMSVAKGMATGLMVGAVAGYVGKKLKDDGTGMLKRKANRAKNTMENIADTAKYIFR